MSSKFNTGFFTYQLFLSCTIVILLFSTGWSQTNYLKIPLEDKHIRRFQTPNNQDLKKEISQTEQIFLNNVKIEYGLKQAEVGCRPTRIIIPPGMNKAFVLVPDALKLCVIDLNTGQLLQNIVLADYPVDMILNHAGNTIYVHTWKVNKTIDPDELSQCPGISLLNGYVIYSPTYVIDVNTTQVTEKIYLKHNEKFPLIYLVGFDEMFLSENDELLYMAGLSDFLYVYDIKNKYLAEYINLPHTEFENTTIADNGKKLFSNTTRFKDGSIDFLVIMVDLETDEYKELDLSEYSFSPSSIPITSPDKKKVYISGIKNTTNLPGTLVLNSETGSVEKFIEYMSTYSPFVFNADSTLAYTRKWKSDSKWLSFAEESIIFDLIKLEKIGEIKGSGYSGIFSSDYKRMFYVKYGVESRGLAHLPSVQLDLSVTNLQYNITYSINVNETELAETWFRSVAVSSENKYVVVTNSTLNTVSIFSDIIELPPSIPELLSPQNNATVTRPVDSQFSWHAVQSAMKYQLQVSTNNTFDNLLYNDSSLTALSLNMNSLNAGDYYWRLRAKNLIGWSEWSEVRSVKLEDQVLPVELVSFSAEVIGREIKLSWSTASETNNRGFEILRKTNNNEFYTRGFVRGSGTTTSYTRYEFFDKIIEPGKFKYVLKQIDLDGSIKLSKEVEISNTNTHNFELEQNFPNPFNPATTISYSIHTPGMVSLIVYNMLGEAEKELVNQYQATGHYKVLFESTELPSGIYYYILQCNGSKANKKMILLR